MAHAAGMSMAATRRWRLSSRGRKLVLAVHVIASVALIGSSASTVGIALVASGAERTDDAHVLYATARTLVYALAIPFSLTALLTGLLLGLGTHWASCDTVGSPPSSPCSWRSSSTVRSWSVR
jgi:hypothetical protein